MNIFDKEVCEQLVALLRASQTDESSIEEIVNLIRIGKLNEAVESLVKGINMWKAYAEVGKKVLEIYMIEKEKEDATKDDPKDDLFATKPLYDFSKLGPSKIKIKEGIVILTSLLGEVKPATKAKTTTTRKPRSTNTVPIKKGSKETVATTNKPPILDQPSSSHATFDNSLLAKNKIKDESDSEDKEEKLHDEGTLDFTKKSSLYNEHEAFYNDDSRFNDDEDEEDDDSFVPGNSNILTKNITKIDDVDDAPFISPFNISKRTNNNQNK